MKISKMYNAVKMTVCFVFTIMILGAAMNAVIDIPFIIAALNQPGAGALAVLISVCVGCIGIAIWAALNVQFDNIVYKICQTVIENEKRRKTA